MPPRDSDRLPGFGDEPRARGDERSDEQRGPSCKARGDDVGDTERSAARQPDRRNRYHAAMQTTSGPPNASRMHWLRTFELAFWPVFALINTAANSAVALLEVRRGNPSFPAWPPITWEASSSLVALALIPAIVAFTRRYPMHWDSWRRELPRYLLASVVFSLVHVVGMVGLRHAVYAMQGESYAFGPWPRELLYEYLKDIRSFAWIVLSIEMYRLIVRRMQGEASLLVAPEEGPAVEPIDRPDRFLVRKLGREFLVAAADIEFLQASGNYVNLHVRGRDYPLRSTIAGIEPKLDPKRFARVHRSYIVNLDAITSIEPLDSGDARLHLADGLTLPCSRRYRAELRGCVGDRGEPNERDAA